MKRNLGEIWKVKEGSKTIWKVQFEKGIMSFNTKREATRCANAFYASFAFNINENK